MTVVLTMILVTELTETVEAQIYIPKFLKTDYDSTKSSIIQDENRKKLLSIKLGHIITRKTRNKVKHAEEGNKNQHSTALKAGWLNDKTAAKQNLSSNRDLLEKVLHENELDINGISEENV